MIPVFAIFTTALPAEPYKCREGISRNPAAGSAPFSRFRDDMNRHTHSEDEKRN
jgi:hypothetical protein